MKNIILVMVTLGLWIGILPAQNGSVKDSKVFFEEYQLTDQSFSDALILSTPMNKSVEKDYVLISSNRTFELSFFNLKYGFIKMLNAALEFNTTEETLIQEAFPFKLVRINLNDKSYAIIYISDRIRQVSYAYYCDLDTLKQLKKQAEELTDLNATLATLKY